MVENPPVAPVHTVSSTHHEDRRSYYAMLCSHFRISAGPQACLHECMTHRLYVSSLIWKRLTDQEK